MEERKIAFPDGTRLEIEMIEKIQALERPELQKLKQLIEKELKTSNDVQDDEVEYGD